MMNNEDFKIQALNDAESSENKIHSDDIAAKYGFTGALVSGVNVFGYLTQPLVQRFGEQVLSNAFFDVIFRKPAYHAETLTIKTTEVAGESDYKNFRCEALNQSGDLLAELTSSIFEGATKSDTCLPVDNDACIENREEIHWDNIHLSEPAPVYLWQPTEEDNQQRVLAQRDGAALYRGTEGFIHPYYLLDACNKALMRMFILPAWIHTGSKLQIRRPIHVGQDIAVHAIPVDKWERKGHQFIRLSILMIVDQSIAVEIEHTAIFRIAD